MFDGVPEQLHQFISSTRTTLPLPSLSFSSLHHHHHYHHHQHGSPNPTTIFPTFDPFTNTANSSPQVPLQVQPSFLHPFTNQQSQPQKCSEEKQAGTASLVGMSKNLEIDIERSESNINPASWSDDEVLALLRIRSSLDNWFPESTWEHVSRKLEELGYKRSAEKCKEKFEEEESRYLSYINYNKSHRFFNEFEDFCSNSTHGQNPDENSKNLEKPREEEQQQQQDKNLLDGLNGEETTKEKGQTLMNPLEDVREKSVASKGEKKRKRVQQQKIKDHDHDDDHHHQFEMLKGFCEDIVKKMMMQQEEMHLKLIEDMVKRDEEKVAREEAWKKQEMDRVNKELEIRAHEQAIAGDRQSTLIKFLKSFTSSSISSGSSSSHDHYHHNQNQCFEDLRSSEESPVEVLINNSSSPSLFLAQNPNDHQVAANHGVQNPSSHLDNPKEPTSQNPNSPNIIVTKKKPLSPTSVSTQVNASSNDRDDIGKRWPRDEVFALINLRCSLHNNGSDHRHHQDKEGQAKIPLWERISQGMLELGYKRSAKRCKEKWENINKYFRKTKDANKRRSLDSRTCPYFHQLSTLYNRGTLVAPSEAGSHPAATLPENNSNPSENQPGSSQAGSSSDSTMHVGHDQQGEKILVQVPTFDFEF